MSARHLIFAALCAFASCTPANRLIIHEGKLGDKIPHEVGIDEDLTHVPTTGFAGQKPGYYVLRSAEDWLKLWEEARPDHSKPPPAPQIDWQKEMAIVATSADLEATSLEITRVIKLERTLYVYIEQEMPGKNCKPTMAAQPLMDIVTVPVSEFDVSVHIQRDPADSCSNAPQLSVNCKVSGTAGEGGNKVLASPGQTIECDGRRVVSATGTITDRNWFLDSRPPGSFAQLSVDPKEEFAKFTVDAYGAYSVREEATDDQEKRGETAVFIDVPPPMDGNLVQLAWTKYDPKDDPTTFPRYELHVVELPFKTGSAKDCTESAPKSPWCEVKTSGYTKQVRMHPQPKARYKAVIHYIDDRFQGAPVLCFRSFLPGEKGAAYRTLDVCDDNVRKANSDWEPGALDFDRGGFEDATKPHVPPAPPAAPASDAGAPPPAADAGK